MEKFEVRVNGRLFEVSHGEERKNEILEILKNMYPDADITCKKLRKKSNMYKYN